MFQDDYQGIFLIKVQIVDIYPEIDLCLSLFLLSMNIISLHISRILIYKSRLNISSNMTYKQKRNTKSDLSIRKYGSIFLYKLNNIK